MTFDIHIFVVLLIILGLIALDFLVGVLQAIIHGTFNLQKFPAQLANFVLPYFAPLVVLAIVQFFAPELKIAGVTGAVDVGFYTAAAAAGLKALADIVSKLGGFAPQSSTTTPPAA